MSTLEVREAGGRALRVHETGPAAGASFALFWHTGSPQTGELLEPVSAAAAARHIRLISYGRPGYGGSTPQPGRNVASAAGDVAAIADALGIRRFAVMGASGGGPHALACAALMPDRVTGAVTLAGIAPFTDTFDWFAGMASPGGLTAARQGREARARFAETAKFDPNSFTKADWAALAADWKSLGEDSVRAEGASPDGLIDDDVAFATDWGFNPGSIAVPVLLVQGGEDRIVPASHSDFLLNLIPTAEQWLRPREGHVSVLSAVPLAMDWLAQLPRG
ncbi:MAG: alpha/beta fold hydrolase [Candidatus Limnocylindrales bacterium]